MSSPVYNEEEGPEWVENLLRRIDTSEARSIENYMERLTMVRFDLLRHLNFLESMQGVTDMPVQDWEWEVSSRMRVWV